MFKFNKGLKHDLNKVIKMKETTLSIFTETIDLLRAYSESYIDIVEKAEEEIKHYEHIKNTAKNEKVATDNLVAKMEEFISGR